MIAFISKFKLLLFLLCALAIAVTVGDLLPNTLKAFFYAISLSIKNIIVFLVPLIVFIFLFSSVLSLRNQAGKFIIFILILVTLSNFTAINVGYVIGANILPIIKFNMIAASNNLRLIPMWTFTLPQIISIQYTVIVSIILGLFFAYKPNNYVNRITEDLNNKVISVLKKILLPILPLFVFGFFIKLAHEKLLYTLLSSYGTVMLLIVFSQALYTFAMYMFASGFKLNKCLEYIKNILPATIIAFSTMSSAATLPVTVICTEKNLGDKRFARIIVPATCNIHTIGSAIGITILSLAALNYFGASIPDFKHFVYFSIFWALAKYAVAGVPGGAIVVAAPLLETYLGLTPEMIGIVTAIYLFLDSFGTATNVTCNGAFAIIFRKLYTRGGVRRAT